MVKVLLAHACPAFRAGVREALAATGDTVIEADSGVQACLLAQGQRPDVAVLACRLRGSLDGPGAAERIHAMGWPVRVLGLAAAGDDRCLYRMLRAGVAGCLAEQASLATIVAAVHTVAGGGRLWLPDQVQRAESWWSEFGARLETLTRREREVLEMLVQAWTNREIAQRLILSEDTVETHVRHVLAKLQLASRRQAAAFWLKATGGSGLLASEITDSGDDRPC